MEVENSFSNNDLLDIELKKQDDRINQDNKKWREDLNNLLVKNWKNPKLKADIIDAIESIKHTES